MTKLKGRSTGPGCALMLKLSLSKARARDFYNIGTLSFVYTIG